LLTKFTELKPPPLCGPLRVWSVGVVDVFILLVDISVDTKRPDELGGSGNAVNLQLELIRFRPLKSC
jgi:hypothetical protein